MHNGAALTWFNNNNYAISYIFLWWYLLTQQYVQRCTCACCGTLSGFPLQYHLPIALAFGRGTVAKPFRDFPLQYRLLITLAFERGAGTKLSRGFLLQNFLHIALVFERGAMAKVSRGFPLQYRLFIALAFERDAVAKLSRHNQAHHLSVKWLGGVDSLFVSPLESTSREYVQSQP